MSNSIPSTMQALILTGFGDPTVLKLQTVPTPQPEPGHAIIRIKAFGINHAEMHMRRGEWAESMPIIGIECVGVIVSSLPEDSALKPGTPVAALMGGLGRTINGSYAQYTSAPLANVVKLADTEDALRATGLTWARIGAIPETYATAWTALHRNLEIRTGQRLLVRGATSAFGRAAVNLAVQAGVEVTATTRNLSRAADLKALGAAHVVLESADLGAALAFSKAPNFDAVLELVGNSTLLESLKLVRRGGRLCLAGFLGGLDPISFNPLLQMASGVHFSFFGSFAFGTEEFPLSDVPLGAVLNLVGEGKIKAEPARVFEFGEEGVREAHKCMEGGVAGGKMVVVVE